MAAGAIPIVVDKNLERSMANRISLVKLLLSAGNVLVVVASSLSEILSRGENADGFTKAIMAAVTFCVLQLVMFLFVRTRWSGRLYLVSSPLIDVIATASLITVSGGFNSPFTLWFALAIVSAGFAPGTWMLLGTTILAAVLHQFVCSYDAHLSELEFVSLTVRSGYLFGFAALVGFIGMRTREHAELGYLREVVANQLGSSRSEVEARAIALSGIQTALRTGKVTLWLPDEPALAMTPKTHYQLTFLFQPFGQGCLYVDGLWFSNARLDTAKQLCERLVATILRLRLQTESIENAIRGERMRLADDLHDYYLQTLAAIDLFAESARTRLGGDHRAADDLTELKQVARDGARKARDFIREHDMQDAAGPIDVDRMVRERWPEGNTIEIEEELPLSFGQWRTIGMMVREGLNNARRHGHAEKVSLQVHRINGGFRAALSNDGDPPRHTNPGYGLRRLQGIALENGGTVTLRVIEDQTVLEIFFKFP